MAPGSNWFLKSAREPAAQIVERPLRGAGADAVAVSEEDVAFGLRLRAWPGNADDDGAHGRREVIDDPKSNVISMVLPHKVD